MQLYWHATGSTITRYYANLTRSVKPILYLLQYTYIPWHGHSDTQSASGSVLVCPIFVCEHGKTQSHTYVCMYVCTTDVYTVLWKRNVLTDASGEAPWSKNDAISVTLPLQANQWSWEKERQKQQSHHQNSQTLHRNATLQMITSCHRNWHDSIVSQTSHTFGKEVTYATYIHKFSDLHSNSSFTPGHNEPPPRQLMKARLSNECNA